MSRTECFPLEEGRKRRRVCLRIPFSLLFSVFFLKQAMWGVAGKGKTLPQHEFSLVCVPFIYGWNSSIPLDWVNNIFISQGGTNCTPATNFICLILQDASPIGKQGSKEQMY